MDVDIQMLQAWLVVAPTSIFYTLYTVLFHKYWGANVTLTNCISNFSIFFPTKATVKLDNGNAEFSQGIRIILIWFPNCSIIYPVGSVNYFTGCPSNTISSVAFKCYAIFQKVTYEPPEHLNFFTPKVVLGYHFTRLKTISAIFKSIFSK